MSGVPTPSRWNAPVVRMLPDVRPLWIVLLTHFWRYWVMTVLAIAFLVVLLHPGMSGLGIQGQKSLAVFVLCVGLWATGALPLHITSILAVVLVPLLGIQSAPETYSNFGNVAVFFILGAFILSAALYETGLSTRIALRLLNIFGGSPRSLRRAIFYLCAFSSFVMSEHAVAALVFPIVLEIVRVLRLKMGSSQYAKSLFLALAWGCIIGGIATLLGGARAPLAIGMLQESQGIQIGFFQWMVAGLPLVIGGLLIGHLLLDWLFQAEIDSVAPAKELLRERIEEMGALSTNEKLAGGVMLAALFSWMFLRAWIDLASTALAAVVLLFVLRVVDWKRIEEAVNWGIVLMYGGAICLGKVMAETGAARWLADIFLGGEAMSIGVLLATLAIITLLLTECISNAAVIALLFPVAMGFAASRGISPEVMTFAVTFPAGLAFMFPMGTPATAIAYSSGYLRQSDLIRYGFLLMISCWIIFVLMALYWWPFLGYNLGRL